MKAILYELGEVLSEDERIYRERDGEKLPLWYIQVPETEAERSILTYAIEGILGGKMKMHLRHDKHKNCQATLLLTGDWDDKGRLKGKVTITHVLSSGEKDAIREQLQIRRRENGRPVAGNKQSFILGSYPITYDKKDPFDPFGSEDTPPGFIDDVHFFYLSILFPSEERKVSGWFRILYDFPGNPSMPVACQVDEVINLLDVDLPKNHFHYHNPQKPQETEAIDDDFPDQISAYEDGYRNEENGGGNFHEDDMRNHFPDAEAYQNWVDSSD